MATKRSGMGTDPLSWILEPSDSTPVDTPPKTRPREHQHVDILEVRDTPLSLAVADYFLCTACSTVVRDHAHDQDQDRPLCPDSDPDGRESDLEWSQSGDESSLCLQAETY